MIEMELASAGDAPELLTMRNEAAQWMADQGIRQWLVGEVTAETIAGSIERGEYWIVRESDRISGALRLIWSDPHVWGEQPDDAGYVHSLVIARSAGGAGLGRAMLGWAGTRTAGAGRAFLRLDCVASNAALRDYYARNGFDFMGLTETHYGTVALWERRVKVAEEAISPCR